MMQLMSASGAGPGLHGLQPPNTSALLAASSIPDCAPSHHHMRYHIASHRIASHVFVPVFFLLEKKGQKRQKSITAPRLIILSIIIWTVDILHGVLAE